jgi:hypothetical protein
VKDEAMRAGLMAKDLPGSDDEYLRDMDGGLDAEAVHKALPFLSKEEAWKAYNRGRNNWVVWTAGNDTLWNFLANNSYGAFDLLKVLSSHPSIKYCGNTQPLYGDQEGGYGAYAKDEQAGYVTGTSSPAPYPPGYYVYEDDECKGDDRQFYEASRQNHWKYFGLVNEPGFKMWEPPERCTSADGKGVQDVKPSDPRDKKQWCGDPERFGLWLDKRIGPPDPFEDEKRYPGVKVGARGKTVPAAAPTTAMEVASSACASSPIPTSTRRRRRSGIPGDTTTTWHTTTTKTWCGPTGSACPAASATSVRAR